MLPIGTFYFSFFSVKLRVRGPVKYSIARMHDHKDSELERVACFGQWISDSVWVSKTDTFKKLLTRKGYFFKNPVKFWVNFRANSRLGVKFWEKSMLNPWLGYHFSLKEIIYGGSFEQFCSCMLTVIWLPSGLHSCMESFNLSCTFFINASENWCNTGPGLSGRWGFGKPQTPSTYS